MLNPWVPIWHEDLNTLETCFLNVPQCEQINILGYLGALGRGGGGRASIIRLGPFWFTSTLSFIVIYMSNMETF